jgi:hypothetical protein
MAFYDTTWYCNAGDQATTGYYAVTKWAVATAIAAGAMRRQNAVPTVNNERVFVCIVAGTTHATTEPTWVLTRGAKTTDNTVTWMECTGASAVNGDLANTANWTQAKAIGTPTLGAIIKRNNGASYWICTTAGTLGASEPAWPNDTAGTTQADGTTTWTCLGVVGNFTGGQAPHARLNNVCTTNWFAAGNTIYVGDNHAESSAALIQINPTGSVTTTGKFICHNHSGGYPPVSGDMTTGATITASGGNNILMFNGSPLGSYYFYGLTFVDSLTNLSLSNATSGSYISFDRCSFQFNSSSNASLALPNGCVVLFNNTTLKFGGTGQYIAVGTGTFIWQNTAPILVSGSSIATVQLISPTPTGTIMLEALDLSQVTGTIFPNNAVTSSILIKDCKLNAALTAPVFTGLGITEQFVRSDSAAAAYRSTRYAYEGTETTETSITRVGGAADPAGQAQSRKILTTANAQWLRPFQAEPYAIWNPVTGANVVVTVCGTINAGALPNNDDIWMEVEYLGSSATPLGTIVTTSKANVLAANAAVASDGSAWNGGGSGAGWSPFKLTATLSSPQPGMVGYIHVRVRAAKVSTTYYIDPRITLT